MDDFSLARLGDLDKAPMSGKDITERLERMRADARAVLALSFTRDVTIARLTRAQAARLTGLSRYSIALAAIATSDQLEGLTHGRIKLRDVRKAHARVHTPSDADIIDFINHVDPNRVLALLDQMTAPLATAAE